MNYSEPGPDRSTGKASHSLDTTAAGSQLPRLQLGKAYKKVGASTSPPYPPKEMGSNVPFPNKNNFRPGFLELLD